MMLEAIRAGIPSRSTVEFTSDLRPQLVEKIDKDLALLESGKSPKGRLVWGEYGQGKTHFLKHIEHHILASGFAVSYISLSRDLNLNNLGNLFPALANHLCTSDSRLPGLLNPLTESKVPDSILFELPNISKQISHPLPTQIFKTFSNYEPQNMMVLYNTLMGKKENLTKAKAITREAFKRDYKAMPKFILKEHLISFMEFLPHLLKSMGYKGWVILIDELEIMGKLGKVGRLNAYKNLSWLLNWSNQHNLPLYTLAASVKALQEEVFYGRKKQDAEEMPSLAEQRFDPQTAAIVKQFFEFATDNRNLVLAPIPKKELEPLLQQLFQLHTQAITWQYPAPENFIADALKRIDPASKAIRQIIRMFIETMDIYATKGTLPTVFQENLMDNPDFEEEYPEQSEIGAIAENGLIETSLDDLFNM